MTPELWERAKAVAADAAELDPAARDAYVAGACGTDTLLRREVESLMANLGDRFDRAADDIARRSGARDGDGEALSSRLGVYEVEREIGRGGMGAVYLARRADKEFEQQVAIKVLKRGTDTDEVLRRFRAERQILARLEHPNIARLIDGGTTPDGLPYFVMEYVEGLPITDFARARNLRNRERVELFLKVCPAVHFAHRNLVIHRDLKPGNILVTADSEPKLLDFGIAKLLSPEGDFAQSTLQDQQRFTPGYASPEQVRSDPVTTASDVYALGALLYDLLTGRAPHVFSTARPASTDLFRVIVEQQPPRASTVAVDADGRRELRGDLDTILETALRKEPERRYSGVTAFSDDLRRYLDKRPVRARPATLGYRASRFVGRNKLGVAAAVLLLASLIGGIATTAWQARRARIGEERAQRRFAEVRKLARAVVFDYHDMIFSLPGATPVRERLVRDALEYLDSLALEAADDRELLRELASAYAKIGKVQGNSYYANLGDTEGALKSYRKSLEIRSRLLARDPGNHDLVAETAKSHEGVGDVLYGGNDLHGARQHYERAAELGERALAARPDNVVFGLEAALSYSRLSDVLGNEQYANVGDTAAALAASRKAQELIEPLHAANPQNQETMSRLANALSRVGMLSCSSGDVAAGLTFQRRAVEIMNHAAATDPNNQNWAIELLTAKHWLRFALEDNNQRAEAAALGREIVKALETIIAADPKNANFRRNLAVSYDALGKTLLSLDDTAGAMASHQTALATIEAMAAGSASPELQAVMAVSFWRLGRAQAATGDHSSALERYRQALALREPVVAADPQNARARDDVAAMWADMGNSLAAANDFAGAVAAFAQSLPMNQELSDAAPTNARLRARLALRYSEAGRLHMRMAEARSDAPNDLQAEWKRAHEYLSRSSAIWQELRGTNRLMPADAAKPDDVERDLARCVAALS